MSEYLSEKVGRSLGVKCRGRENYDLFSILGYNRREKHIGTSVIILKNYRFLVEHV
jgi:hypothetical protein